MSPQGDPTWGPPDLKAGKCCVKQSLSVIQPAKDTTSLNPNFNAEQCCLMNIKQINCLPTNFIIPKIYKSQSIYIFGVV